MRKSQPLDENEAGIMFTLNPEADLRITPPGNVY